MRGVLGLGKNNYHGNRITKRFKVGSDEAGKAVPELELIVNFGGDRHGLKRLQESKS